MPLRDGAIVRGTTIDVDFPVTNPASDRAFGFAASRVVLFTPNGSVHSRSSEGASQELAAAARFEVVGGSADGPGGLLVSRVSATQPVSGSWGVAAEIRLWALDASGTLILGEWLRGPAPTFPVVDFDVAETATLTGQVVRRTTWYELDGTTSEVVEIIGEAIIPVIGPPELL